MNIGIIGFGAIGTHLVSSLPEHRFFIMEQKMEKAKITLKEKKLKNAEIVLNNQELKNKNLDLLIEAASQDAVRDALFFLEKCDVLVMSVGAFTDDALLIYAKRAAKLAGHKLYIPSGAVGGLDVLSACHPFEVILETKKSPKSLGRSDFGETVVFDGSAREACRLFPKNVNVAATISIAGIGFDKTKVRIISDPRTEKNTHTIKILGTTGRYRFTFENDIVKDNPKTSALAAESAIVLIKNLNASLRVG